MLLQVRLLQMISIFYNIVLGLFQLMEISPSGETGADAVRLAEMVLRFACGTVPIPHLLMVDKIALGREMNRENATKYHAQVHFGLNSFLQIVASSSCWWDFQDGERN